jgi:hypothetical protein
VSHTSSKTGVLSLYTWLKVIGVVVVLPALLLAVKEHCPYTFPKGHTV